MRMPPDSVSGGIGASQPFNPARDTPSPPQPGPLPFPPGTNDDTCTGGSGSDVIDNCETWAQ